jgi:hypothetical protein
MKLLNNQFSYNYKLLCNNNCNYFLIVVVDSILSCLIKNKTNTDVCIQLNYELFRNYIDY